MLALLRQQASVSERWPFFSKSSGGAQLARWMLVGKECVDVVVSWQLDVRGLCTYQHSGIEFSPALALLHCCRLQVDQTPRATVNLPVIGPSGE